MMRSNSQKRPQHRRNPNHRRQHSKNYQGGGNQNQNHSQVDLNALDAEQRLDYRPPRNRTMLQQNVDKFLNQAREAMSSGDRAQSESYLQHADHFNRLLNEQKDMQKQNDIQRAQQREQAVQAAPVVAEKKEESNASEPDKLVKKIDSDQLDTAVLPEAIQTEAVEKKKPVKKPVVRRAPRKKPVVKEDTKENIAIKVESADKKTEIS